MQSRVVPMEESKDPTVAARTTQSRVFPHRLLQLLVAFLLLCICFSVISIYMIRYFGVNNAVAVATVLPSFQPCVVEEPTTLEHWIRPPSNLLHNMNDTELLWRASFTSRIKKYPFDRVPKIAFMFLTKGPLPLAPLWERFLKGHKGLYSIYIHSLPSFQVDFPSSSIFYKRQIPSQEGDLMMTTGKTSSGGRFQRFYKYCSESIWDLAYTTILHNLDLYTSIHLCQNPCRSQWWEHTDTIDVRNPSRIA